MPVTVSNHVRDAGAGGKFVVLVSSGDPDGGVLVFSDFTRDFQHSDVVSRWQTAAGTTVAEAGMRVAGGGWWKREGDLLVLYGQSAAYGRFDPAWIRERLRPGMVMHEARIDVR